MITIKIFYLVLLIPFGYFFTFKPEAIYNISWYAKHNVDEEGKQQFLIAYKITGVFLFVLALAVIISLI